ncbi:lysophospholipase [Bartonella sp. CDC_skunk]|uniref:serine aminopeptidase domain-containing protein n=1 Tax=unclassified Bartonella TaxID=2645622 RepID=UPI00099A47B0|nr:MULTISPECIES: alpha/beta hydrolase [unclassified Bartonella]AQX18266.1 lysophospholipase [Bartonella sp. A1379B]AQX21265.1 lysophospholipase [Bartonella sp. CDC_skunk]AQX22781.1 lysophospholipase [Bartonella sp. 11B]AQX23932.1 lysophospholipase [Bartonella sp. 114]AQX25231.1 lysophospholipase [Bartonella sp. Coyote22sub2]
MKTPLYSPEHNSSFSNMHSSYFKTANNHEIRFAITNSEIKKTKGTVVILKNYADTLEEYFLPMNEISQRGFYTAIFDWLGQEGNQPNKQKWYQHNYFNINNYINYLSEFLKIIVYTDCPPPYYMLTYGMGGLIALNGLSLITHQFNRMLCVSPLFAPLGNKTNSFQHKLTQFFSDIGLGFLPVKDRKKLKQKNTESNFSFNPTTAQWLSSTLNAIDAMKTNILHGKLQIPTLFILANQNNIANNIEARQLCRSTHLTDSITIIGAELDTIMREEYFYKQFWSAFDCFISNNHQKHKIF